MNATADPSARTTPQTTTNGRTPVTDTVLSRSGTTEDAQWWRQAAVYQIYPRSFADANGDGIGDLAGIIERIPYLRELGIDAVWLSPFYPSALADGGYDVADYRDVDPRIGTLAEFDEMTARLHDAGIRVVVDIVPNHSSDLHPWFQEALASPKGSPERERYVFRDGLGADGSEPPSDWESVFGGSAWEPVGDGQWYLHLFAREQPDWNWANREIRDDFLRTLAFWADRGVDGFRIDVAHSLVKDLTPPLASAAQIEGQRTDGSHPFWDRDEVHEVYAEWRALFDSYDPPRTAVAEAWVDASRRARYASPEGLGQAFNFDLLEADLDAEEFRRLITFNLELAAESGSSTTWVLSNHDVVRHATRYGLPPRGAADTAPAKQWLLSGGAEPVLDREKGLRRARAATLLLLALPGSAYLYQGEELGLHEVAGIPDADRQDPTFFRSGGVDVGRDGCRVPLPWESTGPSLGFGPGGAHLPQPAWFADSSVEAEELSECSTLALYRRALALRHGLQTEEHLEWRGDAADVVDFSRPNGWRSVTNLGAEPVELPEGELLLASVPVTGRLLPPDATAWLR
ncbi:alpha-amylase [Rathayibacter sp. AY2B7]|uniref:glycoside hydrolase family 13 protein n=1 Tax=Rathayibacter sp. AY2B7 TaxID=2080571 RepID=UPI000CE75395|nr:alpha-amylase family glycosyl hydrolase [Rathayibacter sp. AY2B7]PPG62229.1 alpha-amylase [Rathayibacter sp. AY2B7]